MAWTQNCSKCLSCKGWVFSARLVSDLRRIDRWNMVRCGMGLAKLGVVYIVRDWMINIQNDILV